MQDDEAVGLVVPLKKVLIMINNDVLTKRATRERNVMLAITVLLVIASIGMFLLILNRMFETFGPDAWCIPVAGGSTILFFYFLYKLINDRPRPKVRTK